MKSSWYESVVYLFNSLRFELSTALALTLSTFALLHGYRVTEWNNCISGAFLGWGLTHGTGQERPSPLSHQRIFGWAEIVVFLVKNLQETLTTLLIVALALLGVSLHWVPVALQDATFGAGIAAGLTYGTGTRAMRILEERFSRKAVVTGTVGASDDVRFQYSEEHSEVTTTTVASTAPTSGEEDYLDVEAIRASQKLEGANRDEQH
jgi:hypothetical protein